MKKIFRYLHRQPKHVRDGYAFGAASVFTGIVFMFWVVSFPGLGGVVGNQAPAATKEGNSAFSTLLKQTKEQLAQLHSSVSNEGVEDEVTSSTTVNAEIILSPEDIAKAQQDLQKGNNYTNSSLEEEIAEEVMIATSSVEVVENQEVGSTTKPVTVAE